MRSRPKAPDPRGRRAPCAVEPVLPPELLALGRIRANLIAAVAANFAFYGLLFPLTQRLQDERGMSPLRTWLAFLPVTLIMSGLPLLAGRLVHRFGARPLILISLGLATAAGVILAFVGPRTSPAVVVSAEVLLGVSTTLPIPASTATWPSPPLSG